VEKSKMGKWKLAETKKKLRRKFEWFRAAGSADGIIRMMAA
jgi:hypothetical protein